MYLESKDYDKLFIEFEPLVHKTIHRLNIHQHHMDYEDYFQELQIQLINIFRSFDGNPFESETERYKFTAYAGRGLYWHGINLLKQAKYDPPLTIEDEKLNWLSQQQAEEDNLLSNPSTIHIQEFLQAAKKRLSKEDFELMGFIVEDKHTVQELADLLGTSRDTIYRRKGRIRERLSDIKDCLI